MAFFFQAIKTMPGDFHSALGGVMSLLLQPSAHAEMPGLETGSALTLGKGPHSFP